MRRPGGENVKKKDGSEARVTQHELVKVNVVQGLGPVGDINKYFR